MVGDPENGVPGKRQADVPESDFETTAWIHFYE
jgi:hypothetical protein